MLRVRRRTSMWGRVSAPGGGQVPVAQGEASTQGEDDERREGDDAEPAELDQEQEERLTRRRETGRRIHDDEAGDADGAGGREEGVEPAEPRTRVEPGQELEPERAHQDHGREGAYQELRRAEPLPEGVPPGRGLPPERGVLDAGKVLAGSLHQATRPSTSVRTNQPGTYPREERNSLRAVPSSGRRRKATARPSTQAPRRSIPTR